MRLKYILYGVWAALGALIKVQDVAAFHVAKLTQANFTNFVSSNETLFLWIYAPLCPYCQALVQEYEEAAAALKHKNTKLAKVDCTEEKDLCNEYGVRSYPDLKVLRGPTSITPFTGPRNVDGIVSMTRQSLPVVSKLDMENIVDFKSADDNVLVAYIAAEDAVSKATFTRAAEQLRHRFLCGFLDGIDAAEPGGLPSPRIVLYKNKGEEHEEEFSQPFESEAIKHFALNAMIPLVGEINSDTFGVYQELGLPVGWIFSETLEERLRLGELLRPIASTQKGEIRFGTIDAVEYASTATDLNLEATKFPAFAIVDFATNKKFPFNQTAKITHEGIADFVQDFINGVIEPSITSQPIPEKQDSPVTVVVGHSFQDVVVKNDKDVLVQIYAPWCGHSKRLAPIYDILGSEYADSNLTDRVTVAKIDGTSNDVPDGIPKGYPMLMLYAAGSKDTPIRYDGDRSLEDLVRFVAEKGKHKAVISVTEKATAAASFGGGESTYKHDEL
ncbi:disulfide-isomerase [Coniochaeta sp. 2T2.1]|nr:disulfide-isomerase [Coniochaeta sp. 2T2.1]